MSMPRDRHASRASFACVRCKKDKRRCDISQIPNEGGRPDRSCTACRNKNEKCEVRYGEDKRTNRRPSDAQALHRRMQALEEFVRNVSRADGQGFGQSRSDEITDCLVDSGQMDHVRNSARRAFPSPESSSSPGTQVTSVSMSNQEGQNVWTATHVEQTPASFRSMSFSGHSRPDFDMQERFPPAMDEITPEGDAEDHHHYLGSASLFPYSERRTSTTSFGGKILPPEEESSRRSREALEAAPEPEPIVAYLLDLFWEWQSSHLIVVDRSLFLRHRKLWDGSGGNGDRDFYSPCLLYAILALASMISLDRGVVGYSTSSGGVAGENFAKRARALFDLEMEQPAITTVQAALVLGCRYGALVDNSLGWMYSGIAFRTASSLGLHLDCSKIVASGQMSPEMAELRRRVFWGCHVEDNLFSAYCGRPTSFMEWDITIPVPDPSITSEGDLSQSLLHHTSTLSVMCSKILVGLYGQRRRSSAGELRLKASHLNKELWQWHRGLPKCLEWSSDRSAPAPPQVFILHMTFYFTLILLHRPFLQFSRVSSDLRTRNQSPLNSTTTCAIAAANITKLAINYKRCYNMRQVPTPVVHFMFIAGSIHLINLRLTKTPNHNRLLRSSTEALLETGKSYPIAQKAAIVLQDLIGRWRPSHEADDPRIAPLEASNDREDSGNHGSELLDIEVPASKELDGFLGEGASREQAEDSSPSDLLSDIGLYEQLTEGQISNNCTFLGSGTDWLSDRALFDPVDSNPCSLSYN